MSRAASDERVTLSDHAIRVGLLPRLITQHTCDTVILEELGLLRHRARVDIAAVNGVLHGYEIKSDRDSLRRLPTQIEVYIRVLDLCTVVSGERFLVNILDEVPSWWGVTLVAGSEQELTVTEVRSASRNPAVDIRAQVELLWLDEALEFLEQQGEARGFRRKPRSVVWDRVCEVYTADEIGAHVRARLKARIGSRVAPPLS